MSFTVTLSSVGNPDKGENSERPLPGVPVETVDVMDFPEASAACRRYIEKYDLGGRNWNGGDICDEKSGALVGRVSYNGRVWAPNDFHRMHAKPIYDPRPSRQSTSDRFDMENKVLEIPGRGTVIVEAGSTVTDVTGKTRLRGTVKSSPGEFQIDGVTCEFVTDVAFRAVGMATMDKSRLTLYIDGDFKKPKPISREDWQALSTTVVDYLKSPEGVAMTLRNYIKNNEMSIVAHQSNLDNLSRERNILESKIGENRMLIDKAQRQLRNLVRELPGAEEVEAPSP